MSPITVYLIDDEPDMLDLLSDLVSQTGLKTRVFARASTFFEQIENFGKGAILVLDLHMDDMDGIEVMRKLARFELPPSIILVSGHDSGVLFAAEKLGKAHKLKILASFNKPIPIENFQNIILKHAQHHAANLSHTESTTSREITPGEMHQAILNKELVLHYQPQLEMDSGIVSGFEALVRWEHPELGLLFPDNFLPIMEQNGLMGDLTNWVINEVILQERIWSEIGCAFTISVNISADNITSLTLPEKIEKLLAQNKLEPALLKLEITESSLMGELVTSLDILTRLRLKGIGLSIDDFGTGYSSLVQLHRIPFTELKIDRSFILNMSEDKEALAIVKTCILLGHDLGMLVVGEGIENQETWDLLVTLGCDIAQGYHIARPMPGNEVTGWIKNY